MVPIMRRRMRDDKISSAQSAISEGVERFQQQAVDSALCAAILRASADDGSSVVDAMEEVSIDVMLGRISTLLDLSAGDRLQAMLGISAELRLMEKLGREVPLAVYDFR